MSLCREHIFSFPFQVCIFHFYIQKENLWNFSVILNDDKQVIMGISQVIVAIFWFNVIN